MHLNIYVTGDLYELDTQKVYMGGSSIQSGREYQKKNH